MTQHTGVTSGQTQEELGPKAAHSAQSLPVFFTTTANSSNATLGPQETASSLNNPQSLQSQQATSRTTGLAP